MDTPKTKPPGMRPAGEDTPGINLGRYVGFRSRFRLLPVTRNVVPNRTEKQMYRHHLDFGDGWVNLTKSLLLCGGSILNRFNDVDIHIDKTSPVPAYHQLTDQLENLIRSDKIQIGDVLPPENTLCEISGLSRMTVRRAIEDLSRRGYLVAESGRGTFVVSKEPHQENQRSIGFVLRPDRYIEEDPFYSQVLLGLARETQKNAINLAFIQGERIKDEETYADRYAQMRDLSGLIVGGQMSESFLEYLQRIRIPCVFANFRSSGYPYDAVTYDQFEVGRLLADHLAGLGHRSALYINGEEDNVAYSERLAGFREVFLGRDGANVHVLHGSKDSQSGREMVRRALKQGLTFSAVVGANDLIAIGAMNELQDLGFDVPREVSVGGINNLAACQNSRPPLTSVKIEMQEMGARAVQLLMKRLDDPKAVQETVLLGVTLVTRQSTGRVSCQTSCSPAG